MVISEKGAQPSNARRQVQDRCIRAPAWLAPLRLAMPLTAGLLAGCSTLSSMNPVNWWHRSEGGKIAEERPPPPGVNDPYPNLASVPAKPTPPDLDALNKLTEGLIADREHAQYTAAAAPLPDPSSPAASPSLFGAGTLPPPAPPPPPGSASATLPAAPPSPSASAPPPAAPEKPAAPPLPAPVKPVQSTPLPAPEPPASAAQPPAPAAVASGVAAGASAPGAAGAAPPPSAPPSPAPPPIAAASMPAIPTAPPPPPAGAPPPRPSQVATLAPAPAPSGSAATTVSFEPGSAKVTQSASDLLKGLAAHRGSAAVAVTGYGEATSSDPNAQAAALSLALSRAQSVANALQADGVPSGAIRVGGEAAGRGASVRLLQ